MLYESLLKFKHAPKPFGLQNIINTLFYDKNRVQLDVRKFDYVEVDGCKFHVTDQIDSVQRVKGNGWFEGARPNDTVVDIGANIGAITIPLAKVAKKVISYEPLFTGALADNVKLNKLTNVTILPLALSNKESEYITFSSKSARVKCITFAGILSVANYKIDFLKVDCEGGEWYIEPEQVKGIRELRMEFHLRRSNFQEDKIMLLSAWWDWLIENDYMFEITAGDDPPPFHRIKECYLLRASKCLPN